MRHWPRVFFAVGGLFLLLGVTRTGWMIAEGGTVLGAFVDFVLISFPGIVFLYLGIWLPSTDIDRSMYPRVFGWCLAGVVTMFMFLVLRSLHPSVTAEWRLGTQVIALTIGSIGGLLIGIKEAQAMSKANELASQNEALRTRELELRRQNDRLDQFASIISHDLRTPLAVIHGHLEQLDVSDGEDHLKVINESVERMDTMIDKTLDLATGGQSVDEVEEIHLNEAVQTCWSYLDTDGATLDVVDDSVLKADPARFDQLLDNLLSNAIDHANGDVTVRVGTVGTRGIFIEDTGPGIPVADRESVFEYGYSDAADGTGFGLAIVRAIVDAHQWEIEVTESDEGGARFVITGIDSHPV